MPLDQALIGSAVTGILALLSQAVSKCKCHVSCKRDETGEYCEPSCACAFLDAPLPLFPPTSKDETTGDET
jgi:hypothetical protein